VAAERAGGEAAADLFLRAGRSAAAQGDKASARVCGAAPARRSGSEMGAEGAESEGFDARPTFHLTGASAVTKA
jgi:hypothetical protein